MACAASVLPLAVATQQQPTGRLFPPQDLGRIESPDRDQWNKPDMIMDIVQIAEGDVVAEIGAGGGWFTIRLARRVGPGGTVYAEDIQPLMIEEIGRRARREGLDNVQTVLGSTEDPRLPEPVDAALVVDAYREVENPVALLRNVAQSLKPQGRIAIVEFNAGGGGPGPEAEERVDPSRILAAAEEADLQLLAREPIPPFLFLLVFGKTPPGQEALFVTPNLPGAEVAGGQLITSAADAR